jgi:hypothetical protein
MGEKMNDADLRRIIQRVSPPRLGFWLSGLVPAFFLLIAIRGDALSVLRIMKHPGRTNGVVASRECGDHKSVVYQYRVDGVQYVVKGRPRDIRPRCTEITPGSPVAVSFNTESPTDSIPSGEPATVLRRILRAIAISLAVVYVGTLVALWLGILIGGSFSP